MKFWKCTIFLVWLDQNFTMTLFLMVSYDFFSVQCFVIFWSSWVGILRKIQFWLFLRAFICHWVFATHVFNHSFFFFGRFDTICRVDNMLNHTVIFYFFLLFSLSPPTFVAPCQLLTSSSSSIFCQASSQHQSRQ